MEGMWRLPRVAPKNDIVSENMKKSSEFSSSLIKDVCGKFWQISGIERDQNECEQKSSWSEVLNYLDWSIIDSELWDCDQIKLICDQQHIVSIVYDNIVWSEKTIPSPQIPVNSSDITIPLTNCLWQMNALSGIR